MSQYRRPIGVLSGGADSPGINATIRAITTHARYATPETSILGILNGWNGLSSADVRLIDDDAVRDILPLGGTILGAARVSSTYQDKEFIDRLAAAYFALHIHGCIVIGDHATLMIAHALNQQGVPIVAIPQTMDNDVPGTTYCLGFNSAVHTVVEALDRLHTTASAHHRVMVVEVMGRTTGWVAIAAGIAGGAHCILIPERPFAIADIAEFVRQRHARGRDFTIIVVAEGVYLPLSGDKMKECPDGDGVFASRRPTTGQIIGMAIEQLTGLETRVTVLGHVQRGGSPSVYDRLMATQFGAIAFDLAAHDRWGTLICLDHNHIDSVPLSAVIGPPRPADLAPLDAAMVFTGAWAIPETIPIGSRG